MLYIDGNWEMADSIHDLIEICRNKIGDEFAEKLQYDIEILQEKVDEKDYQIDQLTTENEGLEYEISELECEIINLKKEMTEPGAENSQEMSHDFFKEDDNGEYISFF